MEEKKLSEELRHCLEDDGCGDCPYHEPETKFICKGLLQKAHEAVKWYEEMFPCKVGDTIYTIYSDEDGSFIEEPKVEEVSTHRVWIDSIYFDYDDFGKTVFLTKEAAEKVLKEMEDRKNG